MRGSGCGVDSVNYRRFLIAACHVLPVGINNSAMSAASQLISHAFWKSRTSGLVILSEDWSAKRALPPLKLGPDLTEFTVLEPLDLNASGRYTRYYRRKQSWIFVIQSKRYTQLQDPSTRVYLAGDFNGWEDAIGSTKWELKPVSSKSGCNYELRVPLKRIPTDRLSQFKFVTEDGEWLDVPDSAPNLIQAEGINNLSSIRPNAGNTSSASNWRTTISRVVRKIIVWDAPGVREVHNLPHTTIPDLCFLGA